MATATATLDSFLSENDYILMEIDGDGNCFYRAAAIALFKNESKHKVLRDIMMDHMLTKTDTYAEYFASDIQYRRKVSANRRSGVWNTEIADIVPVELAIKFDITLVIHDCNEITKKVTTRKYGRGATRVHLMRTNDGHYSLLV